MDAPQDFLNEEEQAFLLEVARKTIVGHIRDGETPEFSSDNPKLTQKCGGFVTLHKKDGALRGCIGYVEALKPLLQTVIDMAIACSTRDPRFKPVTPDEFSNLDLEISALTPLEEIDDVDRINVGEHGIMIKKGGSSGLLLPQVAAEYGWDRNRFLRETCRKAGLDEDAWETRDAKIYIFSAQIFGESLL